MRKPAELFVVVALLALVIAACGGEANNEAGEPDAASSGTDTASATPELVGRWERVQSCEEVAHAFEQAHLSALAPAVLASDWFDGARARTIARKKHPCKGAAAPRRHSHFFTKDGAFGSVDQQGNQVDEDPYRIVDEHTLRIGHGAFDYRIVEGETLILHPVIKPPARHRALSHPFKFNTPAWQVAVSEDGLPWKRVRCEGWC